MRCHQWQLFYRTVTPYSISFVSTPPSFVVWGRKEAAGRRIIRATPAADLPALGLAIDYVNITFWTLRQAQWAPIDVLAQSSHGPWSTEVPADPPFFHLCHQYGLEKLSHSSGMIIFCCRINPGDYGYGNMDWSQDLCAISSSSVMALSKNARGVGVVTWLHIFVYTLEKSIIC